MKKKDYISRPENPFGLSIGDLMAALLLIFVLLLSATLLRLQREFESKINVAETYKNIQDQLYDSLYVEFKNDLPKWNASIERNTLTIKFNEPDILFRKGDPNLQPRFEEILADFFPRYVKVLSIGNYKNNIEEIRVEGHTSSEWEGNISIKNAYFKNMKLSQDRTRSVLEYSLQTIHQEAYAWVKNKITANGLSSSKIVLNSDRSENKEASRRVEFRIKTDAEQEIVRMLQLKEN